MAELVFEIWQEDGGTYMGMVSEQTDRLIRATMQNPVRVHRYTASSDFEAFRKNHDWNGWDGAWRPEPDWEEDFFSEEQAEAQRRYLATHADF